MKVKHIATVAIAVLILAIGGWLLLRPAPPPAAAAEARVAVLTDLSSYTAEYGQQEVAGLQLLREDLAAAQPSRPIGLDVQDTKGTPQDGLNGLSQILSRQPTPDLLFVALSSVSTAVLPTADRARLLTISNATSGATLTVSPNSIRNFPSPEDEFRSLYDGAIVPLGMRRLGIVYVDDEYGQSMAALFRERAGANAAMSQAYGFDLGDFRPIIAQANSRSIDGLIVVGYGAQAGNLIRQLRANGFAGRIFVPSLIVNTDSVTQAAGANLRGVIFNGYDYQTSNPQTERFLQRFRARYRGRQSDIGVLAYVGARIVLEHRQPGEPPAATIARLAAAQPFNTILGRVGFVNRSFIYPLRVYQIGSNGVEAFSPPGR